MLNLSGLSQLGVVFAALLAGSVISDTLVNSKEIPSPVNQDFWVAAKSVNINNLPDGKYQFCSQPDPQDWRDGNGVCFNFAKVGNRVDGYYGYPHSPNFMCVRGTVNGNQITGEALAILWVGNQQHKIPESAFKWDLEGRLTLSQGNAIRTANDSDDVTQWILYRQAALNMDNFYQYNRPRMTPPSQLCKWNQLN